MKWLRRATTWLLFVAFGLPELMGQTAKVLALSPEDASEAKRIHAALETAKSRWERFRQRIEREYLTTTERQSGGNYVWADPSAPVFGSVMIHKCRSQNLVIGGANEYDSPVCVEWRKKHPSAPDPPTRYRLRGFEHGFEFSEDLRFLVPGSAPPVPPGQIQQDFYWKPNR